MTIARSLALGFLLTLPFSILLRGQASDSAPTRLRALGLVERPGRVPVFFVRSAEERALRLQKSIQASHAWYEKQFGVRVPIVLAVLDAEMYNKSFDLISTREVPTQESPRLIAMLDRQNGTPPVGADQDHASGGLLQGEQILFHDDGHAFFDTLKIGDIGAVAAKSYNRTVVEFVACVFEIAYMRSERSDLTFFLDDRRSRRPDAPRYATLADFDYLDGIDDSTYYWFMFQMEKMADGLLARHPDFPASIHKARMTFQGQTKPLPPQTIWARFETVWPGFTEVAGPLASPTSIKAVAATSCQEPAKNVRPSRIVIRNESADPIAVCRITTDTLLAVPENSWRTFKLGVGGALALPDGRCVPAHNDPAVFILGGN